jgi:hypothetical protein
VSSQTNAGVRPQQIEAHLQQSRTTDEERTLLTRDIYNMWHQLRRNSLNGRTPIQALLTQFAADEIVSEYQLDADGHVYALILCFSSLSSSLSALS